jgi:hypothetical protein
MSDSETAERSVPFNEKHEAIVVIQYGTVSSVVVGVSIFSNFLTRPAEGEEFHES